MINYENLRSLCVWCGSSLLSAEYVNGKCPNCGGPRDSVNDVPQGIIVVVGGTKGVVAQIKDERAGGSKR